ncbi:hypothetical protein FTUN_7927 [Frigoriglobus tundricola]|uniref:Uncharacterized protein n=1 Tax=Frigoriglobus tundricola TaxID=2774151 RepID=A0A6M5Z4B4_9BACT|nr:hypothetical protein FTUN_7927 [Frigoriglobus tundricola]
MFAFLGMCVQVFARAWLPAPAQPADPFGKPLGEFIDAITRSVCFGGVMGLAVGFLQAGRLCRLLSTDETPSPTGGDESPPTPPA